MKRFIFAAVIIIFFVFHSCRDEDFNNDPSFLLSFSTDTVTFDTIFTTIGSTTKQLRIYNPSKDPIIISRIYLAGGDNSFFKLNVDGDITRNITDIEVRPKDSLFIFIQVTIDPFGVNNPLVVNDSIVFITNGNTQDVNLVAYGQDVHLIDGEWIETTTWIPDKPYLIYNSMGIDSGQILTIDAGVNLYFHKGSYMIVLGTLLVNGTIDDQVIFRGDRLDEVFSGLPYDKIPDQWGGIIVYPNSRGNKFNYCQIRNATMGIFMPGAIEESYQSEIEIHNCVIENNAFAGIYAFNCQILALNSLIANNGVYNFAGVTGGDYQFYHCTIANFYPHGGQPEPAVVLTNFIFNDDSLILRDLTRASFINCIIEGSGTNQLNLKSKQEKLFNYEFDHCLLKENLDSIDSENPEFFNDILFNKDPHFKKIPSSADILPDKYIFDFSLDTLSEAINKGQLEIISQFPELEFDLKGNSRLLDAAPDIGAYERIE